MDKYLDHQRSISYQLFTKWVKEKSRDFIEPNTNGYKTLIKVLFIIPKECTSCHFDYTQEFKFKKIF